MCFKKPKPLLPFIQKWKKSYVCKFRNNITLYDPINQPTFRPSYEKRRRPDSIAFLIANAYGVMWTNEKAAYERRILLEKKSKKVNPLVTIRKIIEKRKAHEKMLKDRHSEAQQAKIRQHEAFSKKQMKKLENSKCSEKLKGRREGILIA